MTEHRSDQSEATKKRLDDERSAREKKQAEQRDAMADVKPTPTQAENDLTASGEHVTEHEADGSAPDPASMPPATGGTSTRQVEAGKSGSTKANYPTRQTTANPSS